MLEGVSYVEVQGIGRGPGPQRDNQQGTPARAPTHKETETSQRLAQGEERPEG